MRDHTGYFGTGLLAAAVLSLVTGLTVYAASGLASRSGQDYPPRGGATPILVIAPTTPPVHPSRPSPVSAVRSAPLTAAQQVEAMRVALADSYVTRLVRGKRYRVGSVRRWSDAHSKMRGAVVPLIFARPTRVSGTLLRLRRSPYRASYRKVLALRVYVDLGRRQVVEIYARAGRG
jgi:hypothetical protein